MEIGIKQASINDITMALSLQRIFRCALWYALDFCNMLGEAENCIALPTTDTEGFLSHMSTEPGFSDSKPSDCFILSAAEMKVLTSLFFVSLCVACARVFCSL